VLKLVEVLASALLLEVVDAKLRQSVDVKGELVDANGKTIKRKVSSDSDAGVSVVSTDLSSSATRLVSASMQALSTERWEKRKVSAEPGGEKSYT
jgi:hypothetical protein